MASVDDRIVSMKFDNKAFEANVGSTLSLLDKLKAALHFGDAGKGLDDLGNKAKGFNLDNMAQTVDSIASRFSAMSVVAITAISNITSRAIDMGIQVGKSFSIDPILDGFHEYETQMKSIQTILANTESKGTMLPDVTAGLEELNDYADKTIYNFSEMTRAVGKFTAAGIDLDTSIASIKGFSNVAAGAGAGAEDTARAMYQLSQAMGSGTVRLMDWMSIGNAGIDTEIFRNSIMETARVHGIAIDEMIADAGSFRLTLEQGWLTKDIMTETLLKFTGDLTAAQLEAMGYTDDQIVEIQKLAETSVDAATKVKTFTQLIGTIKESVGSGWARTFQLVVGDFKEAKQLFTGLNDIASAIIGKMAEARNTRLETWKELGGREALIQSLRNILWSLALVLSTIGKAFREAFPRKLGSELNVMTKSFETFTQKLIPSEGTLKAIGAAFGIVFNVLSIGWTVVKTIATVFKELFEVIFGVTLGGKSDGVINFFVGFGQKVQELKEILVDGGGIKDFFFKYLVPLVEFIRKINLGPAFTAIADGFIRVKDAIVAFAEQHDFAGKFDTIKNKIIELKDTFLGFFDQGENISKAGNTIGDAADGLADKWESFMKVFEFLGNQFDTFETKITKFKDAVVKIFDQIKEVFSGGGLGGDGKLMTAGGIGLGLTGVWLILNKIIGVFKSLQGFLTGGIFSVFTDTMEELRGVLTAMQTSIKAEAIKDIAIAVAILAASMVVLSLIDTNALSKAFTAVAAGMTALVSSMVILSSVSNGVRGAASLAATTGALILVAGAVLILSGALFILSKIPADKLASGVGGVAALLLAVSAAMQLMPTERKTISSTLAIIAVASAIGKLGKTVQRFADMEPEKLAQGLFAISIVMTLLVTTMRAMSADLGKPTGMLIFGAALWVIFKVVESFSNLDQDKLIQGLLALAFVMGVLALTMNTMPKDLSSIAFGLVIVVAALYVMADIIKQLAGLDTMALIQAVLAIAAVLVVIAIAANTMQGAILGAASIFVVAAALIILAVAIEKLANVGFGSVLLSILGLAIALTAIALASILLTPVVPLIAALGAALIVLGAGLTLVGLGALLFGAGVLLVVAAIALLVATGVSAIATIIEIVPKLMVALATGVLGVIQAVIDAFPGFIDGFREIIISFLEMVKTVVPKIGEVISTIIETVINVITTNLPRMIEAGISILTSILTGIRDNIESVTTIVFDIIFKFLGLLNERAGDFAQAGMNVLANFLQGVADNLQGVIDAGGNIIIKFIEGIGVKAGEIANTAITMIQKFVDEVASEENIRKLAGSAADVIINFLNGFAAAIDDKAEDLRAAGANLLQAIIDGMTGGLITQGQEAIDGIKNLGSDMVQGFKDMLGISSPSKVMYGLAGYIAAGLATGLANDSTAVNSANMFGNDVRSTLQKSLSGAITAMDDMSEFAPTITPVLDLTNIESGASRMNELMQNPNLDTGMAIEGAEAVVVATRTSDEATTPTEPTPPTTLQVDKLIEQNNYGVEAMSMSELYRQTKSVVSIAKEELVDEHH